MNVRYVLVWIGICLFSTLYSEDTPPSFLIQLEVYPHKTTVDKTITAEAEFHYPNTYWVDEDSLKKAISGKMQHGMPSFSVISTQVNIQEEASGYTDLKITYQLEPWQSGTLYVSFFEVFFHSKNGKNSSISVLSPIKSVEVVLPQLPQKEALGETQDLITLEKKPLAQLGLNVPLSSSSDTVADFSSKQVRQLKEKLPHHIIFISLISLLIFIVIVYVAYKGIRQSKKSTLVQEEVKIDPKQKAVQALEKLILKNCDPVAVDAFYTQLTYIIRTFIEEAYDIHAPEKTTDELLEAMKSSSFLDVESKKLLKNFLEQADLVKFARMHASEEECDSMKKAARLFVTESQVNPKETTV